MSTYSYLSEPVGKQHSVYKMLDRDSGAIIPNWMRNPLGHSDPSAKSTGLGQHGTIYLFTEQAKPLFYHKPFKT